LAVWAAGTLRRRGRIKDEVRENVPWVFPHEKMFTFRKKQYFGNNSRMKTVGITGGLKNGPYRPHISGL